MTAPSSGNPYPTLDGDALRRRAEALGRFDEWARRRPSFPPPDDAVAAVAFLYELLPAASRARGVDPDGVREMHRRLAVLRLPPPR